MMSYQLFQEILIFHAALARVIVVKTIFSATRKRDLVE